jgi:hypothetical protein
MLGSFQDLINALIEELERERRQRVLLQTHLDPALEGPPLEPDPSPWRSVTSSLIAAVNLRSVAAEMPDGPVKRDLGKHIDRVLSDYPECGTVPRPWPRRGIHHEFYPPSWVYSIASELAVAANALPEGSVRSELIELAGRGLQASFGSVAQQTRKLPSDEDVDAMTEFPHGDQECQVLCDDFLDTFDELQNATGRWWRAILIARLRANRVRRRELHCKDCLPE